MGWGHISTVGGIVEETWSNIGNFIKIFDYVTIVFIQKNSIITKNIKF